MNVSKTVGLIIVAYNDIKLLPTAYDTLIKSIGVPFGLVGIDVGSSDGSYEFLQQRMMTFSPRDLDLLAQFGYKPDDLPHLSRCLNLGIEVFRRSEWAVDYVGWAHVDCDYWNDSKGKGWLEYLVNYLETHPDVGKVAPESEPHPGRLGTRLGNACPWVMPKRVIEELIAKYGFVFDPRYIYMAREDWALNNHIRALGYKVLIAGDEGCPVINHARMGSRRDSPNYNAILNAHYYNSQLYLEEFKTWSELPDEFAGR